MEPLSIFVDPSLQAGGGPTHQHCPSATGVRSAHATTTTPTKAKGSMPPAPGAKGSAVVTVVVVDDKENMDPTNRRNIASKAQTNRATPTPLHQTKQRAPLADLSSRGGTRRRTRGKWAAGEGTRKTRGDSRGEERKPNAASAPLLVSSSSSMRGLR